jgi:hypothetical protein
MPEDAGVIVLPPSTRGAWQVTYNGTDMGLVDMVDPTKTELMFEDITTGTTGKKNVIGQRFVGAKEIISVQFREITVAMQRALCVWSNQSAGTPVVLAPPLNADMYSYGKVLLLHPTDRADTDTTMDLTYNHAVCLKVPLPKRDNGSEDVVEVDFRNYPDRPGMQTSSGVINLGMGTIKGT